jgi:hypothetical protein
MMAKTLMKIARPQLLVATLHWPLPVQLPRQRRGASHRSAPFPALRCRSPIAFSQRV